MYKSLTFRYILFLSAGCLFDLDLPHHCTIDQLPVENHFDENIFRITGSWYLLYTIRTLIESSHSTHIDIQSLKDKALLIASVNSR